MAFSENPSPPQKPPKSGGWTAGKWRMRRRFRYFSGHIVAALAGIVVGGLSIPYFVAGEIYEYQDSVDGVHLPEVDAIVCLAGGRGRIAAAGDLWYRYRELSQKDPKKKLPTLYISGVGPQTNWAAFKKQLRAGVRDVVKPEEVILEKESVNTESNARWLGKYMTEKKWKRVLMVTSAYHMRRSQWIFQKVLASMGLPAQIDTLSVFQEPFEPGEWRSSVHGTHVTFVEYVKWAYYRYFWHPGSPLP